MHAWRFLTRFRFTISLFSELTFQKRASLAHANFASFSFEFLHSYLRYTKIYVIYRWPLSLQNPECLPTVLFHIPLIVLLLLLDVCILGINQMERLCLEAVVLCEHTSSLWNPQQLVLEFVLPDAISMIYMSRLTLPCIPGILNLCIHKPPVSFLAWVLQSNLSF